MKERIGQQEISQMLCLPEAVVHVVVDGIGTGFARAGVCTSETVPRRLSLGGGVGNSVAAIATTLERVHETDPVADLVYGDFSFAVEESPASRECVVDDVGTISIEMCVVPCRIGQSGQATISSTQFAFWERVHNVEIQRTRGSFTKLCAHSVDVTVCRPRLASRPLRLDKLERKPTGPKGVIEHLHLFRNDFVLNEKSRRSANWGGEGQA